MIRGLTVVLVLVIFGFGSLERTQMVFGVPTAMSAEDNMVQVQLILKKLRSSLVSMKDFDELEEIGMDKADVNRMRKAMQQKIKQMTSDAVVLIKTL